MTNAQAARPIQILLVEDSPGDVRLTEEILRDAKIANDLHVVNDGEQAMDFLRSTDAPRPDVMMLDLNLPRKDGREVLAELKGDPELRRIPVIVLTTSSADQDVLRSYDLNANCYITKPIDLDEFISVVRSIENFWLSIVRLPPQ
ncbi:MAG: response regulator [Actinomycetota bacterium]|nr:response regulator [Actinomycetota bacterium]